MKGKYPVDYFHDPNIYKPIEEIWDDIDAYSGEFFEDEEYLHNSISMMIPLPPLQYEGKFIKGIFLSQACDYILKLFPDIKKIFHVGAYTMWSSYSWCDKADVYFACYKNPEREAYHKRKYPLKKDIIFLPLQDADYTNEYFMAPSIYTKKTVDVICVSTPLEVKNLPVLAKALKIYEQKYGKRLSTIWALGNRLIKRDEEGNIDYSELPDGPREQMRQVEEALGSNMKDYGDFYPYIDYNELVNCYAKSRALVLCSLIEGKNRSINEALSCNTPVIAFAQHNQWARCGYPIFFGNSGELVPEYSPESLADTIHKVLTNQKAYEPRKNYLKYNGRKNFIDICARDIPYYRENVPDFDGTNFHDNLWIDLATQYNYQVSYNDFLYSKKCNLSHVQGIDSIRELVNFYYKRFGITPSK